MNMNTISMADFKHSRYEIGGESLDVCLAYKDWLPLDGTIFETRPRNEYESCRMWLDWSGGVKRTFGLMRSKSLSLGDVSRWEERNFETLQCTMSLRVSRAWSPCQDLSIADHVYGWV